MRRLVCLLAIPFLVSAAGDSVKAEFIGGTLPGVSAKSSARLDLTGAEALLLRCQKAELEIPYRKIDIVEYGQSVSRRYAEAILISPLLLLSKSRKHYVTIGYTDTANMHQALVLRVEKGDIRPVLAGLEARTGRRVEYLDSNARGGAK